MIFRIRSPKGIFGQNMSNLRNGSLTDVSRSYQSAILKKGSVKPEADHHRARKCEFHLSSYPSINIFANLCLIAIHVLTCCTCTFIHSPACITFSFPLEKIIMTCKYFLLFCFTLAFIRRGNGNGR